MLGPVTLTSVGLGAMIGSGIFVLTGTVAAQHTGPAMTLAFLVAALGCGLAALCYAELAAMIPVSGSAYSYTYATLGEGIAWFVGWNLALEYVMSAAAVAVGWSGYVVNLLGEFGIVISRRRSPTHRSARLANHHLGATGAIVNVPAVLIVALLTWVCYIGVKQSTRAQQRDGRDQGRHHRPVHRGRHQVRPTRTSGTRTCRTTTAHSAISA